MRYTILYENDPNGGGLRTQIRLLRFPKPTDNESFGLPVHVVGVWNVASAVAWTTYDSFPRTLLFVFHIRFELSSRRCV